jgi:hypothetical protein
MPVLADILMPNAKAAEAALGAVGAIWDRRLDLDAEVDGVKIARRFGVLQNPLRVREATAPKLLEQYRELLELPLNAPLRERALALEYCPTNKATLVQLADGLLGKKVHLPFTLRPMMLDLASRIANYERPFPFDAFYARSVQIVPGPKGEGAPRAGATINAGRLFSVPVAGNTHVTRMEPLDEQELDLRVGLLLEVDAFGG